MSDLPNPHGTGSGQIGNGAAISTGDAPDSVGGKLMTHAEPLTGAAINRGTWAVSENVQHIWSRMKADNHPLAVLYENDYTADITSGDDGAALVGTVFCGDSSTASASDVVKVYDHLGFPLIVNGVEVVVDAIKDGPGGLSVFGTGFVADPWVDFNVTIPKSTNYTLMYGVQTDLDEIDADAFLHFPPVLTADNLVKAYSSVYEGQKATEPGQIFFVQHAHTGRIVETPEWQQSLSLSGTTYSDYWIATNGSVVVVLDKSQDVWCYSVEGELLWHTVLTISTVGHVKALAVGDDFVAVGTIPTTASNDGVTLLSVEDGSVLGVLECHDTVDLNGYITDLDVVGDWVYGVYYTSPSASGNDTLLEWNRSSAVTPYASKDLGYQTVYNKVDVRGGFVAVAGTDGTDMYVSTFVRAATYRKTPSLLYDWASIANETPVTSITGSASILGLTLIDGNEVLLSYGTTDHAEGFLIRLAFGDSWRFPSSTETYTEVDIPNVIGTGDANSWAMLVVDTNSSVLHRIPIIGQGPTQYEVATTYPVGVKLAVDQEHVFTYTGGSLICFQLPNPATSFENTTYGDVYRPYPTNLGAHPANLI